MWTLIIYTVLILGRGGGMSSATVPGFSSLSACEKAGHELVTKAPETRYFYSQTEASLFGPNTSKLHSRTHQAASYGYQCVEVK